MIRSRSKLVSICMVIAGAALLASCVTSPTPPLADADLSPRELRKAGMPRGWELVWADEFDGPEIDASSWTHEVDAWGGGNNESQYYTDRPENSFVQDGALHLVARQEVFEGPEGTRKYTSARLNTSTKGEWTYGRYEIRARLPEGQGIWPAIWMLPTDNVYGTWAASGEIDIMELVGDEPERVHGTVHYGGEWPDNHYNGGSFRLRDGTSFSDGYHVFTLIWEEEAMHWYVDGTHFHTQTYWRSDGHEFPAPFDQRFHFVVNVAVGGNWPGDPDDTTVFPQTMEIDYMRVYQAR